jgi:hypothetical protein
MFPSATGALKCFKCIKRIDWNLPDNFGWQLPFLKPGPFANFPPKAGLRRHQSACSSSQDRRMIIPFSADYHVPDSTDWCSSSCPSLAGPRTGKRRGE